MAIIKKLSKYFEEAYGMGHFPSTRELLSKRKIFAYYGFLGDGNFGDELVYEAARKLFAPDILIPVRRRMPVHVAAFLRTSSDRISGVVIGGGTLIGPSLYSKDFFEAQVAAGKPIYMHGTGLHKMEKWHAGWKPLLKGKLYGGIRGPLSIETMTPFRSDIKIAGDAAFILQDAEDRIENASERKTILVNCGAHDDFDKMKDSREALSTFLSELSNSGADIRFLPCFATDIPLGEELKQQNPSMTILEIPKNYAEAQKHFREAKFAIGERLHFVCMALLTGCPFLSVNYALKHVDMLKSVGLADAGLLPKEITVERIRSAYEARGAFDWQSVFSRIGEYQTYQQSEMAAFKAAAEKSV